MSIKIENTQVFGWEGAIRGARNPMNSWEKSDSRMCYGSSRQKDLCDRCEYSYDIHGPWNCDLLTGFPGKSTYIIGPNDHKLLMNLCKGGTEESKWRRMVHVQMDVTAPLYWWKEFETYKVGTVSNSCSTMHKIHAKEFTLDDFSWEHLFRDPNDPDSGIEVPDFVKEFIYDMDEWKKNNDYSVPLPESSYEREIKWNYEQGAYRSYEDHDEEFNWVASHYAFDALYTTISAINHYREKFLETKDKKYWYQMIQLLPSSYNQRRTIDLNYEVLAAQYRQRKDHKLDEWHQYCDWIRGLPYSEFITMEENK